MGSGFFSERTDDTAKIAQVDHRLEKGKVEGWCKWSDKTKGLFSPIRRTHSSPWTYLYVIAKSFLRVMHNWYQMYNCCTNAIRVMQLFQEILDVSKITSTSYKWSTIAAYRRWLHCGCILTVRWVFDEFLPIGQSYWAETLVGVWLKTTGTYGLLYIGPPAIGNFPRSPLKPCSYSPQRRSHSDTAAMLFPVG